MGLKKLFKIKPPEGETLEQNRAKLSELGVPTKGSRAPRKEKFAAYGKFAADKSVKTTYVPPGYENYNDHSFNGNDEVGAANSITKPPSDPYSAQTSYSSTEKVDPYSVANQDPYSNIGRSNPYSSMTPQRSSDSNPYRISGPQSYNSGDNTFTNNVKNVKNPYADMINDKYSTGAVATTTVTDSSASPKPPYAQSSSDKAAYARYEAAEEDDELDLNAAPAQAGANAEDDYDLNNSLHEEDGVIGDGGRGFQTFEDIQREQQLKEQQEEDEDVDGIKQQIRFTKQSSVAATRNTLKMAQDAELAGRNALGVLGHQSEKLANVEQNLHLMKVQNRLAEDQVGELKKLNRNILAVHVSNPFTSKRRMREAEERIKALRLSDRPQQEAINNNLVQSTQRIESALTSSESGIRERYQRDAVLRRARQYQFENDEEDDEMELEIDRNLNQISQVSGRLRKLAISAGKEIDSQKNRVQRIEENADDLDLRIHVNTNKLTNIR